MEHFTVKELKQIAEAQHLLDSMEEIGGGLWVWPTPCRLK